MADRAGVGIQGGTGRDENRPEYKAAPIGLMIGYPPAGEAHEAGRNDEEPDVLVRGASKLEASMIGRCVLVSAFVLVSASPVLAGPCSERLAELEKSITASQEGAGPVLEAPAATGSTSSVPAATPRTEKANQAMQMLQEAKQLDQQGKEAECMQTASKIEEMVPAKAR
jgi:hypothetical protein